ncbi:MAG TPA: hypothetical protein VK832_04470 [Burkholderiaceae bacterium]|nr:hypothetical protein [Burkholderiaceae bacterium]
MDTIDSTQALSVCAKARTAYPNGLTGKNFIPLTVDGNQFELSFFTDRRDGKDVEFCLFPPGARYSRKSIIAWDDGRIGEDTEGVIPEFDRLASEPVFSSSNQEILKIIEGALTD